MFRKLFTLKLSVEGREENRKGNFIKTELYRMDIKDFSNVIEARSGKFIVIYMQCIYKAVTQKSVVYSIAAFLLSLGLIFFFVVWLAANGILTWKRACS